MSWFCAQRSGCMRNGAVGPKGRLEHSGGCFFGCRNSQSRRFLVISRVIVIVYGCSRHGPGVTGC